MTVPRPPGTAAQPAAAHGIWLRAEPDHTTLDVVPGELALIRVRLSVEGTPKPLKGRATVSVEDPAFEVTGISEVRRQERTIEIAVHGRFRDTRGRDIRLSFEIDGLNAVQTVTFVPVAPHEQPLTVEPGAAAPPAPPVPSFSPAVPFARPRDPLQPASTTLAAAPAPRRLAAAVIDLVASLVLVVLSAVAVVIITALIVGAPCGTDPTPGSACSAIENTLIYGVTVWVMFVGVPLYLVVTNMVGRSIGKRMLGLRVVCVAARGAGAKPPRRGPGWWRGLLRTALSIIGLLCLGIGYLWMFTNRDRRTWHDLAAGTMVIDAKLP
jgi:uncharacterized RDD family membrane protein YckC